MPRRTTLISVLLAAVLPLWSNGALADDPVTTDPAQVAAEFPASMAEVTLPSHDKRLAALMYMAEGEGPHPTAVLLHGYPGNEKNLDLAQALRRAGWNVFFFHYRGAWGSEGNYNFANAVEDVQSAIDFLRTDKAQADYRIDPMRIVTVGHSLGGHMAMEGILNDPGVACVVFIDGVNLGRRGRLTDDQDIAAGREYADGLFMLRGWSGAKLMVQDKDKLDLEPRMKALAGRPALFIAGGTEGAVSIEEEFLPLTNALDASGQTTWRMKVLGDDHSFSSSRIRLARQVTGFLNDACRS